MNTCGLRVIVALSGGVDSSVAALVMLEQGHDVEALFMKNWEDDDDDGRCAAARDLADARSVCDTLGIRLHTVNLSAEYWHRVFRRCLAEYEAGRTPNPDVLCNREIKFRACVEHAARLGADCIATGHHARIGREGNRYRLLRGKDPEKDQSYFLYMLDQAQLGWARFPVGELTKAEVRARARAAGLCTHDKKDSTGLCFVGERPFKPFLARYLSARPGPIRTPDGRVIGRHDGLMYYTIGQRRGLGIGGPGAPWYVADKDFTDNALIVVQGGSHPALFSRSLEAESVHWIAGSAPPLPLACHARVRYRQRCEPCVVRAAPHGVHVEFARPQRAVAAGQSVVFYRADECLGGGVIRRADGLGAEGAGAAA